MNWLDRTLWAAPLWAVGVGYLAVLLIASWVGLLLGRRRAGPDPSLSPPVATEQAALFGLLALLLAFTYSQAAERFELRRHLLVEEANAIGTVWLRADFLPEPDRTQLRETLREYVELRVVPEGGQANFVAADKALRASAALHDRIWGLVTRSTQDQRRDPVYALLINETNNLIGLHTSRIAAYENRVPGAVLVLLALVSVLSMILMGFGFGRADRTNPGLLLVFAVVIAAVTLCILDLDHSHRGWTRISQSAFQQLGSTAAASR